MSKIHRNVSLIIYIVIFLTVVEIVTSENANTDIVVRDINKVARYERQRGVLPPEEMAQLQGYKRQIVGAIKRGGKGTGSRSVLASVLGGLDHTWNKYAPKLFRRHELAYMRPLTVDECNKQVRKSLSHFIAHGKWKKWLTFGLAGRTKKNQPPSLKVAARTKHEYYLVGQCLRGAERSIGYHHPDYEQDYASQTSLRRTASAPQGYHHPKAHVQQLRRTNSAPVGSPAGKKPSSMFGWLNPKNWAAWGRSRRVKRHHDSDSSEDSSDSSDYSYDTDYSSENGEKSRGGRRTTRGGRDWDRDHGNYVERSRRHEREYDRARKFDRFRDHDRDPDLEKGYGREPGHGGPAEIGGGYGHPQAQSQAPVYYGHRPNKRQADDDDERKENPVVTIFKYFLMLLLVLFLLFFVLPTVMTMLSFLFFG